MTAVTVPAKVARNLTRSFFEIAYKRCNSNGRSSKFEISGGELRAKLLWFVVVVARALVTAHVNPIGGGLGGLPTTPPIGFSCVLKG